MLKKAFLIFLFAAILMLSAVSCGSSDDDVNADSSGSSDQSADGDRDQENDNSGEGDGSSANDDVQDEGVEGGGAEGDGEINGDQSDEDGEANEDGDADVSEVTFVYSINSKKYHLPSCYHVRAMKAETKVEFTGTLSELAENGYSPCKSCKPDPDFDYENSEAEDDEELYDYGYVININTGVFHKVGCSSVDSMNEENKEYSFETRDELINKEYSCCKNCNP